MAGIAAGSATSGDVQGVAKGAGVIGVQIFTRITSDGSDDIYASDQDIVNGINHVLSLHNDSGFTTPIDAINMSLGGETYFDSTSQCEAESSHDAVRTAIESANTAGVEVFVATGNENKKGQLSFPSCVGAAIAVAASTDADGGASFSNIGTTANFGDIFFAPGDNINSSVPGNTFTVQSGTSMATPYAAGAWSLLTKSFSSKTKTEILGAITSTGVSITDNSITLPRTDVAAAYNNLAATAPTVTITASTKTSGSAITNTTIQVTDDVEVKSSAVSVDGSTTATTSSFSCTQADIRTVNCTVSVDTSGNMVISATDTGGTTGTATESGYVIESSSPTLQTAEANGYTVTLTYNESLLATSVPATSDYVVTAGGISLAIASVEVSGSVATITLSTAVTDGQTVTIDYTAGANPLKDLAGNNAANLSGQAVSNTTDTTVDACHNIDASTASLGFNTVSNSSGVQQSAQGKPFQEGDQLGVTATYVSDQNEREYARIFTYMAPIRDALMCNLGSTSESDWTTMTEVLH